MAAQRPDPNQPDLLTWRAPAPVQQHVPHRVRAATLAGRIKRAIAETLRETEIDRDQVAAAMGDYLGEPVAKASLDAWASGAREDRLPSLTRFCALLAATADERLLQVLAAECGWAVVDRKWLPMIELASVQDHENRIVRRRKTLQAECRRSGALP